MVEAQQGEAGDLDRLVSGNDPGGGVGGEDQGQACGEENEGCGERLLDGRSRV